MVRSQREPGGSRLTRNAIHDNGKPISRCFAGGTCDKAPDQGPAAIVFRTAPVPAGIGAPPAQPIAAASPLPPAPTVTRLENGSQPMLRGTVRSAAPTSITVEVFGGKARGDAEAFLGAITIPSGSGDAAFAVPIRPGAWRYLTATATTAAGMTSVLSEPLAASR